MDSCAGSLWLTMPAVIALMMEWQSAVTSLLMETVLTSSVAKYCEVAIDGGGVGGGVGGGGFGAFPGEKGGRGSGGGHAAISEAKVS